MAEPLDQLAALISSSPSANFGPEGVPADLIAEAERHLGNPFPPSYRWWLGRYGSGYLNGYALNGLCPEPIASREPGVPITGDVVDVADRQAKRGHPRELLEILSYEGDEVFYLDLSRPGPDGEVPVLCRNAGDDELVPAAATFADFLTRELSGAA